MRARRRPRVDAGLTIGLAVGLFLVGGAVWLARYDRLARGGHSVPAEPAISASPTTPRPAPHTTVLPAPPPPAGSMSSDREIGTVESAPPRSPDTSAAAAAPSAVGAVRAPRPATRQPERPATVNDRSEDAADGTAIIDWLLKGGRSGG